MRITYFGWMVAIFTLAADQFSKWALIAWVSFPQRLTSFFDLVMVWNHGISFGLMAGHGEAVRWIFVVVAVVIGVFLARWLARTHSRFTALALGLVLGGAAGNVIDRLRVGAVADFFSFHIGPYAWPAFNVADSAICIGVALLCAESMLPRRKP